MDRKLFFHTVCLMRTAQREYFKTRSSAALAQSKLLEKTIDDEIKRAKAVLAAKAKPFYELVNIDLRMGQEWINDHVVSSLDDFFCDVTIQHQNVLDIHLYDHGYCDAYDFPTLVINDVGDVSGDDMLEFKFDCNNGKYYVSFLHVLKG